jgi:2-hydroxymuconate-semialdehyde hydrolase
VISGLVDGHRLVVPDVPGLGESEPLARLDLAAFADWLAELVEVTCREEPTVVAHSLFGNLVPRVAARRRGLMGRLVIYAAAGLGPYRIPLGLRLVAMRFALRPSQRNHERFARWAFFDLDRTRLRDPDWFEAFGVYMRSRAAVPHVKATMRRLIPRCTKQIPDAELRRIHAPTTLLWGRHDRFVSLAHAEAASARLGWPLHIVENAGHVPHIEQPDGFLEALAQGTSGALARG